MNENYQTVCLAGDPLQTQIAMRDVEETLRKDGFRLVWAHVMMDHRFVVFYKASKHER